MKIILLAAVFALFHANASAAEPVAYITEIHRGGGEVQVKTGADQIWKTPRPLLGLSAGDQVRVAGEARVVLLYHRGDRTVTVTPTESPFTVQPVKDSGSAEQVRTIASSVSQFLFGKQEAPALRRAASRGDGPVMVSPRHTRVLPGPLVFEWDGPDHLRYGVKVVGPDGIVWTQTGLPRASLRYPTTAPPLAPGVRYTWELQVSGRSPQATSFEIVTDAEATRIRALLAGLDRTTQGYPRTTVAVMQAALLYEEGLFAEARRALEEAAATDPREATVRFVLGHVYEHVGLSAKAAKAFDDANDLIAGAGR